ncbi:MAG: class I SAM-dependent methyltransferase [Nanobdellota archaeon]
MHVVRARLRDAEKVKRQIIKQDLFDKDHKIFKDDSYIYFPLKEKVSLDGVEEVNIEMPKAPKENTLSDILKERLSEDELEKVKTAFDTIGDIAILEIDDDLKDKEGLIAEALLRCQKNINTVVKKAGIHDGTYRVQPVKHLAGEKKTVTVHKENNARIKVDVNTVYFSPRLSTERKRITHEVGKGEEILVMFSGAAPYPCVLARNTEAKSITGVEINPEGHEYGLENIRLNKLKNVTLYNDDVNNIVPKLGKFDRILMPLPKSAEDFLDTALSASKHGTVVHFYDFLHIDDFHKAEEKVAEACRGKDLSYEKLSLTKCGQHAPRTFRVCLDFRVSTG